MVLPHDHCANAPERAIQMFKNHLIAGLSGVDPIFPIKQWDIFLPQATIILNLLHLSRLNPKLLAHTFVYGKFNFNSTPLAPLGTKVVAHIKTSQKRSWGYCGEEG